MNIFLMHSYFYVKTVEELSGAKLIKLRIRTNFIISSSDFPKKVPDIFTKLIF